MAIKKPTTQPDKIVPSTPVTIENIYTTAHDMSKGEAKTSGIKTRGNGAATKGVTARGPMG